MHGKFFPLLAALSRMPAQFLPHWPLSQLSLLCIVPLTQLKVSSGLCHHWKTPIVILTNAKKNVLLCVPTDQLPLVTFPNGLQTAVPVRPAGSFFPTPSSTNNNAFEAVVEVILWKKSKKPLLQKRIPASPNGWTRSIPISPVWTTQYSSSQHAVWALLAGVNKVYWRY